MLDKLFWINLLRLGFDSSYFGITIVVRNQQGMFSVFFRWLAPTIGEVEISTDKTVERYSFIFHNRDRYQYLFLNLNAHTLELLDTGTELSICWGSTDANPVWETVQTVTKTDQHINGLFDTTLELVDDGAVNVAGVHLVRKSEDSIEFPEQQFTMEFHAA